MSPEPARPPLWRELLLGLAVFGLYALGAGVHLPGHDAAAAAHARDVFGLEQRLRIDVERPLNAWLAPHEVLSTLANYEYATTYVISAFTLIFWIYARRPEVFRWARTSFVLLNLVAVGCFVVYPMQPPRLMPEQGFVDTVLRGHTWGSWGSPLVEHANTAAAMPSLHFAWAIWVSVFLAYISGGWRTQLVSAFHVLLTLWVILATGNHYLLDAVAGGVLAWACVAVARRLSPPEDRDMRVPAPDVFFLHVENDTAPQHVGGVVWFDTTTSPRGSLTRADVVEVVRGRLATLPRFRQRLSPASRWRRPRWVDHPELDWEWHVTDVDLTRPDGSPAEAADLHALAARIAEARLPRDRPLWRIALAHGVGPGRVGMVIVVHHVIADGVGAIAQALKLLDPPFDTTDLPDRPRPSIAKRAAATVVGIAQLATDGRPHQRLGKRASAQRRFTAVTLPLDVVRATAKHHNTRVTDLLLSIVAGALRRSLLSSGDPVPDGLRVAVPLMVREPGASAEGNVTAAVMVDVPLAEMSESVRLAQTSSRTRRLRSGTRALASRFVMQAVGELLPVPAHAWFARTVYGRRFFHGIVSNMPGPPIQLSHAGCELRACYPLLPLAPGSPLAVGAIGWNARLCVGISVDAGVVPDAAALGADVSAVFDELRSGTASFVRG